MIQEIFSFNQVERLDWNDFIESEENREAVACLSCWPKSWNTNGVVIYGAQKVGKTHLASLWAQTANAIYILRSGFSENPRYLFDSNHNNCNFVIDNFDEILEAQSNNSNCNFDKWMFDFFNICREKKCFFLILSRTAPSLWNVPLRDLRSRLQTLPAICIKQPNDSLLLKIGKKISKDFGIEISDETIGYIMEHVTRDVPTLSETLKMLDRIALQKQKSITIAFVRKYFGEKNGHTSILENKVNQR